MPSGVNLKTFHRFTLPLIALLSPVTSRIRHHRKELDARLAAAREEQRISDLGRKSSHLVGRSSGDAFLNGARGGLGNRRASTGIRAGGGVGAGIKRPLPKNSSSSAAEKRNVGDGVPEDDCLVEDYHSDAEPSASASRGLDSSSDEEEEKRSSGKWRGGQDEDWEDLGLRQVCACVRARVCVLLQIWGYPPSRRGIRPPMRGLMVTSLNRDLCSPCSPCPRPLKGAAPSGAL